MLSSAGRGARCVFCERPDDAPPFRPRRSVLSYRDSTTHAVRQVQMPRELQLCLRCRRDEYLLAGCPRCRRYGRYHAYGQAPYGSSCDECGAMLWLLSGDTPVR